MPQREVPERQAPERELPYGPEVSWPSGFPQMDFDTGEYHRLVDDYSHVDPRQGYADAGYGDAGYGDPGYADPRYDGQGQYTPGRQDSGPRPGASRHQEPPQYQEQQHQEPAYPVTGAQEVYREPDSARYAEAPYSAEQVEPRHPEPRAVDPRLEGLRYDELRYDDPDLGEPGFSEPRYDEPLDDDAWYAELRRGGPAFPQAPTPSGPSRAGGPSRSESPYANGNPPSGASPRTNPPSGSGPVNGGPAGGGAGGNGGRGPAAAYRSAPAGAREISGPREISGSRELGAPRDMGGSRENGGPRETGGPRENGGLRENGGSRRPGGSPRAALPQRPTVPGSGPQGPVPQGLAGPQRPAVAQASSVAQAPVIARSPSIAQAPPGLRRPAAPQNFAGGPGTAARPEQAFLGAPPVSVLTPPTGNRMDSFAGPATQTWDAVADAPELESLEEYWQDDEGDVEYTALLEEFDVTVTSAPARSRPSMPRPSMPHPSVPRIGRRRGGSKDHRLWIGLGGVVIVAAAAIFGIVKFEFPSGGETHTLTTPATVDGCYARNPGLAKSMGLPALITKMTKTSGGTDPVSAAYEGPCGTTASSATQIVAVLEAHLANDSPAGGLRGFKQEYPNAKTVSAGPLGGEAGCTESNSISSSSSVALCSWFDDDSFGVIFSPTMSPTQLATAMLKIRSAVELKG